MKIAQVVATLPPDIGGMGRVAFDESTALAIAGHEVAVFTLFYPISKYQDDNLPFRVVRARPFLRSGIAGFVPDWRSAFKNFDLIHLHYPFYGGAEWVWLSGVPYVVTYHMDASPTLKHRQLIKNVYDRLFAKNILQKAKRVILVDERHYLADRKILFPDQSVVIPNGIDTELFKPGIADLDKLGLDSCKNKKMFLFVGNLLRIKGLSLLLNAWKKFETDETQLVVVGGGFEERHFRDEADRLGIRNITWLGSCFDQKKMSEYYSAAYTLVVPSLSESFSLVSAEAMASGTPVVASDLPGIAEKVKDGETGFIFKKGDENSLLTALQKIKNVSPEERQKMGEKARTLVINKYGMKAHLDALLGVYKEVV